MVDTFSGNVAMTIIPRGGDSGTWDTGTNLNWNASDGMFGGVQSYSLTNANRTVALPVGFTPTPGAGPTEAQNAMLKFTGTLTGNCVITCTRPGYFICYNACTVGAFYVSLWNGSGNAVGLPPGRLQHVFNDGTNYYYVNLPEVGAFMDLCGVSAVPAWVGAATIPPYLLCDGSVYNIAIYPFLGNQLGATFGGNGATTFGVPDLRGKWRVSLDPTGTHLTSATMSPNGNTLNATGGAQNQTLAANQIPPLTTGNESAMHTHATGGTKATNTQTTTGGGDRLTGDGGNSNTSDTESTTHTHSIPNASQQPLTTLPPVVITGITLIRAG